MVTKAAVLEVTPFCTLSWLWVAGKLFPLCLMSGLRLKECDAGQGSLSSTQLDSIPEMQTFGRFYTLNKCFLIASGGPQVFLPELPSRQLRLGGSEPESDPSDELDLCFGVWQPRCSLDCTWSM